MQVVLYTTADPCPLCVDAWLQLDDLRERLGFRLETVDVESDPAHFRLYRGRVPVVVVDGREVAFGRLDPVALEAVLVGGRVEGGA